MAHDKAGTTARILEAAYALFYRQGFNRTDMDDVAAAAGVSKRTLYVHFDSKDRLLAEALAAHEPLAETLIGTWADALETDLPDGITRLFDDLAAWSRSPGWVGSGYTRLALELADLPGHPAREIARRHKARVAARIANALARGGARDPEALAAEIQLLIEGASALTVLHGTDIYCRLAGAAARRLVESALLPARAADTGPANLVP
jgi:AcrR family transcriptional regulator